MATKPKVQQPKNSVASAPSVAEFSSDLTVVLSGENSLRASLHNGQLDCPADFALRAYLAAALVHLAATLTAKGPR